VLSALDVAVGVVAIIPDRVSAFRLRGGTALRSKCDHVRHPRLHCLCYRDRHRRRDGVAELLVGLRIRDRDHEGLVAALPIEPHEPSALPRREASRVLALLRVHNAVSLQVNDVVSWQVFYVAKPHKIYAKTMKTSAF